MAGAPAWAAGAEVAVVPVAAPAWAAGGEAAVAEAAVPVVAEAAGVVAAAAEVVVAGAEVVAEVDDDAPAVVPLPAAGRAKEGTSW